MTSVLTTLLAVIVILGFFWDGYKAYRASSDELGKVHKAAIAIKAMIDKFLNFGLFMLCFISAYLFLCFLLTY